MLQLKEAQNMLLRRHEERRKSHFVAVEDGWMMDPKPRGNRKVMANETDYIRDLPQNLGLPGLPWVIAWFLTHQQHESYFAPRFLEDEVFSSSVTRRSRSYKRWTCSNEIFPRFRLPATINRRHCRQWFNLAVYGDVRQQDAIGIWDHMTPIVYPVRLSTNLLLYQLILNF